MRSDQKVTAGWRSYWIVWSLLHLESHSVFLCQSCSDNREINLMNVQD